METCALNNLCVVIQKTMSSRNSEDDVMIKFCKSLGRAEEVVRKFSSK